MVSETTSEIGRFEELRASFEALRGRMEALEAMAHAATELFTEFPYMPRKPRMHEPTEEETHTFRRTFRRMQSLVLATASEAGGVLDNMDDLSEQIESVIEQFSDSSPQSGASASPDDDEPGGQNSPTFQ